MSGVKVHHLDYEPPTGDSWCVECQIVFGTRAHAEAHTTEPVEWIDSSCGKCGPCRETYDPRSTDPDDEQESGR